MNPQQYSFQSSGARPIHGHRNSLPDTRSQSGANGFASVNGPMPVPGRPPGLNGNHHGQASRGPPGLPAGNGYMSKSPPSAPNQKNTKHVPCKFFYKGQCAAGDTCPYSHNPDPPEPCKFFLNGNCKYGNSCALPHYSANGALLNPGSLHGYRKGRKYAESGGRQRHNTGPAGFGENTYQPQYPQAPPLDRHMPYGAEHSGEYGSPPNALFGSPAFEGQLGRSPPFRTALDAPLPPSFSSQDTPNIQKFGPNAMSVPAKGGLGPLGCTSPTTSMAHRDPFGGLDSTIHGQMERLGLGSSPPDNRAEVAPRRIVPNGRSLLSRDMPASLPVREPHELFRSMDRRTRMDDDNHEEDFLPSTLSELMTPQEKLRRFSRSHDEPGASGRPPQGSFVGSPGSKVGSPSGASPSRFSGFFAEQQARRHDGAQLASSPFGNGSGSFGSPLRNSSLPSHMTKQSDAAGNSPSFGPISPPGFKERPTGVSSLSEQLRKARNPGMPEPQAPKENTAPVSAPRSASSPTVAMPIRRERVTSGGAGTAEKIDEEDCFFSMEDEKAQ